MQIYQFHAELRPRPQTPAPEVRRISVEGAREPENLILRYTLEGDWTKFAFPDPHHPAPPDRLWAHGCCELFWREQDTDAYREYNFSPSRQWSAFSFSAYRKRQEDFIPPAPGNMDWQRDDSRLILRVEIPVSSRPLQAAFAVVLEYAADGKIIYYALSHPAGMPDFHHPDNFALALP